jgi:hypothetical protein
MLRAVTLRLEVRGRSPPALKRERWKTLDYRPSASPFAMPARASSLKAQVSPQV